LIVHCCHNAFLSRRRKTQTHLIDCILDQLATSATLPLQLHNPLDPRARKVAEMLVSDAGKRRPLQEFCRSAGASKRTIERIFQRETGMSLGKWRQQLRIMQAVRLLAAGEKVSHVALEAGYSAPGAFAAMFRKLMGTTPGKYFN
jgi:AraC-like DNA-binding protein